MTTSLNKLKKIHDMFAFDEHEAFQDLHFKWDPATGMQAIIAIHNTRLGPAFGGCRFVSYEHTDSAIIDALRLAKGMSYKSAIAGLNYGGGKSVIIKPKGNFDRKALFQAFGRFVQETNGRYITAKDAGTTLEDMDVVASETSYVASTSSMSDPSPFTAHGVRLGIEAAVKFKLGQDNLKNITVAIQGAGYVGYYLAKELHALGAKLIMTDTNPEACERVEQEFQATIVAPSKIYSVACDVFSPAALGAILNEDTIDKLQCTIVAGAANNQLAEPVHGYALKERGILYAPDYVINSGGIIHAASTYDKLDDAQIVKKIEHLYEALFNIFTRAQAEDLPTHVIADHLALARLEGETAPAMI